MTSKRMGNLTIKTLEHLMVSYFLILECFKEILANCDLFVLL